MSYAPAQELNRLLNPEMGAQSPDAGKDFLPPVEIDQTIADNVRRITGFDKAVTPGQAPEVNPQSIDRRIGSSLRRISRKGTALITAATVTLGVASPAIAAAEQATTTTGTSTLSQTPPRDNNQETTTSTTSTATTAESTTGTTTAPEAAATIPEDSEEQKPATLKEQKLSTLEDKVKSFLDADQKANELDYIADRPSATDEDIDSAAQAAKDANAQEIAFRTAAGEAKDIENNELVKASVDYIEAVRAENAAAVKANSADATKADIDAFKKAVKVTDTAKDELKKATDSEATNEDEQVEGGAQAPDEDSIEEQAAEQQAASDQAQKLMDAYKNAETDEERDDVIDQLDKLIEEQKASNDEQSDDDEGDDQTEEKVNPDHFKNVWTGDEKNGLIGKFEINPDAPVQSKENFFKELRHNPKALAFWVTCLENGGSYEACVEKPGVLEKAAERVNKYANMSAERKSKVYERLMKKFDAMKYGGVKEHNGPYKTVAATTDGGFAPAENTRYNDYWLQFIQDDGTVIYIRQCDQIVKNNPVAPQQSVSAPNVVYASSSTGVEYRFVNAPSGSGGGGTSQEDVQAPSGSQDASDGTVPDKDPKNKNGSGNSQAEADGDRGTDDQEGRAPAQSGTSPNNVPAQQQQQEPAPVEPAEGPTPPNSGNEQTGNVGAQPTEPAKPAAGTTDPAPAIGSKPGATTSSLRAKISNIKSAAKDKVYGVEGVQ